MTPQAAARIQSAADRSGTNAGFKARAQSAAEKNAAPRGDVVHQGPGTGKA